MADLAWNTSHILPQQPPSKHDHHESKNLSTSAFKLCHYRISGGCRLLSIKRPRHAFTRICNSLADRIYIYTINRNLNYLTYCTPIIIITWLRYLPYYIFHSQTIYSRQGAINKQSAGVYPRKCRGQNMYIYLIHIRRINSCCWWMMVCGAASATWNRFSFEMPNALAHPHVHTTE